MFFMQQDIGGRADNDRQQGNKQHKLEHTPAIHFDGLSDQISHPQRRHHRSKDGGNSGHADRKGNIAFSQKTHNVGRNTARTSTDQNQTQRQSGRKVKGSGNTDGKQRHDSVLGDGADKNVERTLCQNLIIFFAQSHAHTEHDDAEYNDLRIAFYPRKSGRFDKGDDRSKDDNQGGEAGHLPTDSGQKVHYFSPVYVFIMTIITIT